MSSNQPITLKDQDRLSAILDADECNRALYLVGLLKPRHPKPTPAPQQQGVIMRFQTPFAT